MKCEVSNRTVPRVSHLTREEFVCNYLKTHTPFIVTGETAGWPAIDRWSLDHLARTHYDHPVLVEYYPNANRNNAYTYAQMTVAEYIELVRLDPAARRKYYLADITLEAALPRVLDEVGVPSIVGNRESLRPVLFFGYDTFSASHYHRYSTQALLTQITGSKEVILYPAKHTRHTYPHPWYGLRPNFSRIKMEIDTRYGPFEGYPNLALAEEWRCVVEPGEMLFIPDHWMHIVTGHGENVSLTFFWDESWRRAYLPGYLRDCFALASKAAMVRVARIGKRLGLQHRMIDWAIRLGIVPREERDAVEQHLDEFDGKLPALVNANQVEAEV